jgi:hypothetical protein
LKFNINSSSEKKNVIVIPTYWSRKKGECREGDLIFDHPTPLDEEGTLIRCLESLNMLKSDFILILIVIPTHSDIEVDLEKKIKSMILKSSLNYRIIVVFQSTIDKICEKYEDGELKKILNLKGYSQVRNACILIPSILNFKKFILLDDDEVVLDEDFLEKAVEDIGSMFEERKILAKAGIYLQSHGSPFFREKEKWWRIMLDGKKAMNEAFKITKLNQRYVDTPFAFGGNMSISSEVVEKGISFDPYISRGEDIDFLVNIKAENFAFVFDNYLKILHLPPGSHNPLWMKLREDTHRFLYMRCKLQNMRLLNAKRIITSKDLLPYPGPFLDWTLKARIFLTSILLAIYYVLKFKFKDSLAALYNIKLIFKNYDKIVNQYSRFREKYRQIAQKLINRSDLTEILDKSKI